MKSIGIVLVDWNGEEVTIPCLEHLVVIETGDLFTFRIVVVDNGSDVPIAPTVNSRFPDVVVLRSPSNLGFAGGNNIGIRYLLQQNVDLILLLNNDTIAEKEFLLQLFRYIDDKPSVAAVQPRINFLHDRNMIWNAGTIFNPLLGTTLTRGYGASDKGQFSKPEKMPWLTGCCMLIRASVLKDPDVGLLNERYQTYYEDAYWSMRARKKGYELHYVPTARIFHIAGFSVNRKGDPKEGPKDPLVVRLHTRNRIWFMRTCTPFLFKPFAYPYHILYILSMAAFYVLRGRKKKLSMVGKAFREGFFQTP
jgi:GT2 family glycosyltransferase